MPQNKSTSGRRLQLTKGFKNQVSEALDERVDTTYPCTVCGYCSWQIGNFVALPLAVIPHMFNPFPKNTLPFVTVFCTNCGNTHFLNLLVLGFNISDWETTIIAANDTNKEEAKTDGNG